jgi:hypothetical protein
VNLTDAELKELNAELRKHEVSFEDTRTQVMGETWRRWTCSCGSSTIFRPRSESQILSAAGRHLWAVEKRVHREIVARRTS